MDTIEKPQTEKITEPAKQWRNRYRALTAFRMFDGTRTVPGEIYDGAMIWPSKEVAEEKAWAAPPCGYRNPLCDGVCEYLGAFPVTQ